MNHFSERKLIISAHVVIPEGNNPTGYIMEIREEVYKVLERFNYMMAVNLKVELLSEKEPKYGN